MKRSLSLLIAVFYITGNIFSLSPRLKTAEAAGISITANSAYMMDGARGNTLYSKRENLRRQPASTVKVLTALVVAERLSLNNIVTIPAFVNKIEPSKVYLKPGEHYSVRSLLEALLLSSANDAAYVLAIAAGGSQEGFCRLMNDKAKRLGAKGSHFTTPHGLPDDRQYTTTRDLTLFMQAAEKNPALVSIMRKKTSVIYSTGGRKITLRNHNKLLWRDPRDIIGKTGWTRKARHCFVGRVAYGQKILLFAIMGSARPWNDLSTLINAFTGGVHQLKKRQYHEQFLSIQNRKQIQRALQKSGFYKGKVDGKFGPKTHLGIVAFQKSKKLKADGIIGPKTYNLLKKYF